jgi:hypothetical protein
MLFSMVARTSTGPQQRLDFGYDWRGRCIMKKVWNNMSGKGASVEPFFGRVEAMEAPRQTMV